MKTMTYGQAIKEGMSIRMRENPNVYLLGEDVGAFGGCFGVSAGMFEEFGEKRIRDTPISEGAIIGTAIGSAATGLRPIAEIMMGDFVTVSMDQLVNQAAKMRYMFGGKISLPLVVRLPGGAGVSAAAQHSQSLEAWLVHIPGLKVIYPSTPQDALGLMLSAIDDDNPVIMIEHKALYAVKGDVYNLAPIPFGKGDVKRKGNDITIIATGKMVYEALTAAEKLETAGISAEVIDPRSLYPLDKELIADSVSKTHHVIVTTEETKRGSYAGELSAYIHEELFDRLDSPVIRVCALNTPIPFAPNLEKEFLPNAADIFRAAKELF